MAERVECQECGQQVAVRKDGTLYTHKNGPAQCPGAGQPGGLSGTAGLGKGQPYEPEAETAAAPPAPPRSAPAGHVWQCTVTLPCPYLDDPAWHQANGRAAEQAARAAGHTPAGEAAHTGTAPARGGRALTLTYTVPTSGGGGVDSA